MERVRLDPPITFRQFQARFENLKPGERFRYHEGELAHDRLFNFELNKVAERALVLGTDEITETRPHNGTDKGPPPVWGEGQAILFQRLNGYGHEYWIVKRRY